MRLRQAANDVLRNDVTACAANDVMLRINDVALRTNGTEHLSHIGATILPPNKKVLDFQGLLWFLGLKLWKKNSNSGIIFVWLKYRNMQKTRNDIKVTQK